MHKTPEYSSWESMIQRCNNQNNRAFKDYGGRGITVCKRWLKFENFYADMGARPPQHSLERIDNNKGYTPTNARWATRSEQQRNRRTNRLVTIDGRLMTIAAAAELIGVKYMTAYHRLTNKRGG